MNKRQIGVVGCRVFALYVAFWGVTQYAGMSISLASVVLTAEPGTYRALLLLPVALLPCLVVFGVAVLFWRKADWIAVKLLPDDDPTKTVTQISTETAQALAFSVVGAWALVHALPSVVYSAIQWYADARGQDQALHDRDVLAAHVVSDVVRCAVGFGLLLGARCLTGLVRTFRTAGIRRQDSDRM